MISRKEAAAKILGVPLGASRDEVKDAYRKLALQFHPDISHADPTKFAGINEAYKVLNSAHEVRNGTFSSHAQRSNERVFTSRAGYRPGNTKVAAACGVVMLGGCALFGTALWLHLDYKLWEQKVYKGASSDSEALKQLPPLKRI
mmetsp:Transcript_24976/g.41778  ORF Transcript_24976/g.41778 Transcript_24976/m.41778 type:complete len:145 (-) Transcript_24976:185-619(-)